MFEKSASINSEHKVTMEWNYNAFIEKSNIGCYIDNTNTTYDSANADSSYDSGISKAFFDAGGVDGTMSASSGAGSLTVTNASGTVSTGMRVSGSGIPAKTYVTSVSGTTTLTVGISNNTSKAISSTPVSFYTLTEKDDDDRKKYTPLDDIFKPNRPDPGIINLTSYNKYSEIIDTENITFNNFGNANNGTRADRVYPMYKNVGFRYWNSVRQKKTNNIISTIGVSDSSSNISSASPFAVYEQSFWANKIVIKTQKYSGYPLQFKVQYLPDGSNTWTTAIDVTGSESPDYLLDGILEIYYNGSSWSTTKSYATQFIDDVTLTPTDAVKIRGIRLLVTKMSTTNIPVEVIEISPRYIADVTAYVMSFDKSSSMSASSSGLMSGVITGTSSLRISNVDRIFSNKNTNSILSGRLVQGIETKYYSVVDSTEIPLGTFYAEKWEENTDFTTSIQLADYFFFLNRQKAPDIVIANTNGIELSAAALILLDNAGVTNYNFINVGSSQLDDYVLEFFFCNKNQTVYEVLEQLAVSAQYSIFMDVNNIINIMTKEKFTELVPLGSEDFWFVGSENYTVGEPEYSYLNNKYLTNVESIQETVVPPITDATISYRGNGVKRQPKDILSKPEIFEDPNNIPFYNASIIDRGLSYMPTELWSLDMNDNNEQEVLLAMPFISDISDVKPTILDETTPITGTSENDVVRYIYNNADETDKKYFEIVLDPERATEFMNGNKFSGYILIESELIKYRGIVVNVFDSKVPANSGKFIVFNRSELTGLISSTSSGSSVLAYSILVDINLKISDITGTLTTNEVDYYYVSDGRGQKDTTVSEHKSGTTSAILQNRFAVKLYGTSYPAALKAVGTMKAKSVNLLDPRKPNIKSNQSYSYPGYLKVSGPKGVWSKGSKPSGSVPSNKKVAIPIDNLGEQHISGFYKNIGFKPHRISTRMRLLEKPKKSQFTTDTAGVPNYHVENRGIAGIGFRLNPSASGTTGYFVEIEDVGNITDDQLAKAAFENIRLYRVAKDGSNFVPTLLAKAWINVSAVSGEALDVGQSMRNEGRSYAGTSDLTVVIDDTSDKHNIFYTVYWETQAVAKFKEPRSAAINLKSTIVGLMVRYDTEAMFDYLMCSAISTNSGYKVFEAFGKGSKLMDIEKSSNLGLIPGGLSESIIKGNKVKFYYEDFGKNLREVQKFSAKYETPAISAQLISLSGLNPDYNVVDFSSSSYGADFWVFNTSRSTIALSADSNTSISISGTAINSLNPGEVTLDNYIKNRVGEDNEAVNILERNKNKYGINSVSLSAEYLNSPKQAEQTLSWIFEHSNKEKKEISVTMFPNPLLEIGDKVRVYYSDIDINIDSIGDAVYYITSIRYSVSDNGPTMEVVFREI